MAAMVELCEVSKRFGSFTALEEVSFDIEEGEFMTFLGPSGCGKTTCLRLISGFDQPTTGRVLVNGVDVTPLPPYKRDVNQVFQSYALFPHLTIEENIAFGLRMKKLPAATVRDRVARVVEMTGLESMVQRKPSQLSGGQRQRVALARAIVCEPKVLLLDEPLSALDAKLRQQMRSELKSLQRRIGVTFIFVTHDQEEALTMSDRIAVLSGGRIEQIGTVEAIYYHPKTRFVAQFIGEMNLLPAKLEQLGNGDVLCHLAGGEKLTAKGPVENSRMVAFRPEKVQVVEEGQSGNLSNTLVATVESEVFKGALEEIHLRSQSGESLTVLRATTGLWRSLSPGDTVTLRIAPEDISLLAE
jgi:spermidine/putrescine transport system ATP-binding protein